MPTLPTVRVKSSHPDHVQGFYTINESDFDPKIHELWKEDEPAQQTDKTEDQHPVNKQKVLHLPMHDKKG
jgi:hypothetical protein